MLFWRLWLFAARNGHNVLFSELLVFWGSEMRELLRAVGAAIFVFK